MSAEPASDDPVTPTAVHVAKPRQCLRCGTPFSSSWAGERICGRCKGSSGWRQGVPAEPANGTRR
ncbi:MAG: hypothetical protein EXQ97_03065 [Alphaproteobacteria bacterium]|nr:hypothetical protein [Alphaproteobacteria bacterium]